MKLPSKLRIGPYDYRVEDWGLKEALAANRFGECDRFNLVIRINCSLQPCHRLETVLHEVGHAIYDAYKIIDSDTEERIIGLMGLGWAQVFRDNPKLLDWIKEQV